MITATRMIIRRNNGTLCRKSSSSRMTQPPSSLVRGGGRKSDAALLQFLRYPDRKIGEHTISTRTLERDQALGHCFIAVQPSVPRCGHDHGIFPGHLIGVG